MKRAGYNFYISSRTLSLFADNMPAKTEHYGGKYYNCWG